MGSSLASSIAFDEACRLARSALEKRKRELHEELASYPRPIAGCDVQYKDLVEQLDGVREDLATLQEIDTAPDSPTARRQLDRLLAALRAAT
jgi:hypothetical protein